VAPNAFYNSAAQFDKTKCHENTRVAVLKKIMRWILGQDETTKDNLIMWLTGAAGAGKSSIAQSIIQQAINENLAIATFFFNKSDGSRNTAKSLVATLTYQVYISLPHTQPDILACIDSDPLVFGKNLNHQFVELIVNPLLNLCRREGESYRRRLIVIDGLDECVDRESQGDILDMLRNSIRVLQLPVLFLIASRPEHNIQAFLDSEPMKGIPARLVLDDNYMSDMDIKIHLSDMFNEIRTSHPFRKMIPTLWPGESVIDQLVKASSGQLIYLRSDSHSLCHVP